MIRILANDGIDPIGKEMLTKAGFEVVTNKVPQEELVNALKDYQAVLVRSASKITKEIIEGCPNLKLIGRAGVGVDNIDVAFANAKGIPVVNTPAASSQSVAELVFAHLFSVTRFLHDANRRMPADGANKFDELKKQYAKGVELRGKTLGIIGFGKIGQCVARMAIGLGMNVVVYKLRPAEITIKLDFHKAISGDVLEFKIKTISLEDLLKQSDFISLHIPFPKGSEAVIGQKEIAIMKNGAAIINTARGGVVDEAALLEGLNSGKIAYAGIDVFKGEPNPNPDLLKHPRLSLTPHTGASTNEAQERIGTELAEKVIAFFKG